MQILMILKCLRVTKIVQIVINSNGPGKLFIKI